MVMKDTSKHGLLRKKVLFIFTHLAMSWQPWRTLYNIMAYRHTPLKFSTEYIETHTVCTCLYWYTWYLKKKKTGRIFLVCYKTYCYHVQFNISTAVHKERSFSVPHSYPMLYWLFYSECSSWDDSVVQWVSNRDVWMWYIISVASLQDQQSPAWDCIKNTSARSA